MKSQEHLLKLLEDVKPKYICPYLIKNGVLSENETEHFILKDETRGLNKLLDHVISKGKNDVDVFLNCLKEDDSYCWVYDNIVNYLANEHENILQKGTVPFKVAYEIKRDDFVKQTHNALCKASQKVGYWVVLHGMAGSGKSVLASQSLRELNTLPILFPGGIWWLPIGKLNHPNALLMKLQMLLDQFDFNYHPDTEHAAKMFLHRKVMELKKCLLILDDVWDSNVISVFDVGWTVLVTTRDEAKIESISHRSTIIKCDRFTLSETKRHISERLNIDIAELNPIAEKLHEKFKGLPIMMSLVASKMSRYGRDQDRWQDLQIKLEAGQIGRQRRPSGTEDFFQEIRLSIEELDEDLLHYYQDFIIFWDDFYVPCKVFETLWNLNSFDVIDIMETLQKKSLVLIVEDPVLKQKRFGVHDLYLNFLKKEYENLKEERHRFLVSQYLERCRESDDSYDFGKLPSDDGYIHSFFAYHIHRSGQYHLFPQIFLNLQFIQRKLRLNGPHDIIYDLDCYQEFFENFESTLKDFQLFLRRNGHNLCHEELDIIQLALNESSESEVYKKAILLIKEQKSSRIMKNKKYFYYCNRGNNQSSLLLSTKPHLGSVFCAVFSGCDKFILSGGEDNILKLWDSHSGKHLHQYNGHTNVINCCIFSSHSNQIASASKDKTVRIWNMQEFNSKAENFFNHISSLKNKRLSLTPNSRRGSWNFENNSNSTNSNDDCDLVFKEHNESVATCTFSHDNQTMASGSEDGIVLVWKIETGTVFFKLDNHAEGSKITSCCFSINDRLLVSASTDSLTILWDLNTGCKVKEFFHNDFTVTSCCFSCDGKTLLSSSGQYVWRWNIDDKTVNKQYNNSKTIYLVNCCNFSRNEEYIVGGTSDGSVVVWNADSSDVHTIFKGHLDAVQCVNLSTDGSKLVSADSDGTVMIWDMTATQTKFLCLIPPQFSTHFRENITPIIAAIDESNRILVIEGLEGKKSFVGEKCKDEISVCCLSPDNRKILYGAKNGFIKILDRVSRTTTSIGEHDGEVTCCLFLKDSESFVTASNKGQIRLWNRKEIGFKPLTGHDDKVIKCLAYDNKNGQRLLSCSMDGMLKSWDLDGGTLLVCCSHDGNTVTDCDVSRTHRLFASSSVDKTAKVWNENGDLIYTVHFENCVRSCQFSPCSNNLAAGDDDGTVKIFNLLNKSNYKLQGHRGFVSGLIFSSNSDQLVTIADEICWWKLNEKQLLQTFNVKGKRLRHICASPNFDIFITIDAIGTLYILNQINT